ncbi:MAG: methyltransferase domain-containing protein [Acetobacteraceae bacterium]
MSERTPEAQWSRAADGWARWAAIRAAMVPATETLLDLAAVAPGSLVLDIGCGSGEQTVMAAERAGPAGHVLAIDISAAMIAATDKTVAAAGLRNVSTRVCGVAALTGEDGAFNAAICRLVLMLVPDPTAAARAVWAALRPGGAFAAMVHGDPAKNPLNRLATEILARHGGKTVDPQKQGFFALSDPTRLEDVMRRAGFADVVVTTAPVVRRLDDAAMAVAMVRESYAGCIALIAGLPPAGQAAAWAELEQALARFEGPEGCVIPGEFNLVAGRRPAGPGRA